MMDVGHVYRSWIHRVAGLGTLFAACYGLAWLATRPQNAPPPPRPIPAASAQHQPPPPTLAAEQPAPRAAAVADGLATVRYAPRDPREWQGMRVNLALQASCDISAHCGLAMACLDGRCGPCASDGDCAAGEGCAVQHCVPLANLGCRSAAGCKDPEARCLLSGISPDPRGNAEMHAYCSGSTAEFAREVAEREAREAHPAEAEVAAQAPTQPGSPEALAEILSR